MGEEPSVGNPASTTVLYNIQFVIRRITPNSVRNHLPQMVGLANIIKHPLTCVLGQMCTERGLPDSTAINMGVMFNVTSFGIIFLIF